MTTHCNKERTKIKRLGSKNLHVDFDGGHITSDAGSLLLDKLDSRLNFLTRFAACFTDHRDQRYVEHSVKSLVRQRTFGLALGYEDLNDHDELSHDPLLAAAVGIEDPTGSGRRREQDKDRPLAGKSTLNRLELAAEKFDPANRYRKIVLDFDAVEQLFLDMFFEFHDSAPDRIILDFDATDDPLHGSQEGRFFHGYYDEYCYLPLYVFCGDFLLIARLRRADIDASTGTVDVLKTIVPQIQARWPSTQIIVRADSGFARDSIMTWCEQNSIDYVLGLAKNSRLKKAITTEQERARQIWEATGQPARVYKDFRYRTLNSWSRERRVIGKAEHIDGKANPRFIVTSLSPEDYSPQQLYEDLYCPRGDMENRIKEQQLCLFADRTSTATMRANQIRLFFSSAAYVLVSFLRRVALHGTALSTAQCDTIRLRLLKIGAAVRFSVRRVVVAMATSYPLQELFWHVLDRIRAIPLRC